MKLQNQPFLAGTEATPLYDEPINLHLSGVSPKEQLIYLKNRAHSDRSSLPYQMKPSHERGLDVVVDNYQLVESLAGPTLAGEPDCTVCIPTAIGEDPERVVHTLSLLQESAKHGDVQPYVLLWFNAYFDNDAFLGEQVRVEESSRARYQAIRQTIAAWGTANDTQLTITSALKLDTRERMSMSRIRADYMDAVVMTAQEGEYSPEHPVIWFDVDTPHMTRNTLRQLISTIRKTPDRFAHTNFVYATEWAQNLPLHELDLATKGIVLYGVYQRMLTRFEPQAQVYPEESGLAMSLELFIKGGGLKISERINEAYNLVKNTTPGAIKEAVDYVEARISRSGRRVHKIAGHGLNKIPDAETEYYDHSMLQTACLPENEQYQLTQLHDELSARIDSLKLTEGRAEYMRMILKRLLDRLTETA